MAYSSWPQWATADLERGLINTVGRRIARHEEKPSERFVHFRRPWLDAFGLLLSFRRATLDKIAAAQALSARLPKCATSDC